MKTVKQMEFKDKQQVIKYLLRNYLKQDNNLYLSNKLFIANTAVNWIYNNTKQTDVIKHYLKDIEKYLKGELDLFWVNGILIKKKVSNNDKPQKEKI